MSPRIVKPAVPRRTLILAAKKTMERVDLDSFMRFPKEMEGYFGEAKIGGEDGEDEEGRKGKKEKEKKKVASQLPVDDDEEHMRYLGLTHIRDRYGRESRHIRIQREAKERGKGLGRVRDVSLTISAVLVAPDRRSLPHAA